MPRTRLLSVAGAIATATVFGLFVTGSSSAVSQVPPQPLTIYASFPQVGAVKKQAQDVIRGARLALEDNGGQVNGVPILFKPLNDGSVRTGTWSPARTARNARTAALDPTTIAYLGEFNSGASGISIPITNQAGILQVSPSNTYVGLTRRIRGATFLGDPDRFYPTGEPTYGRIVPNDRRGADTLSRRIDRLGLDRVVVVDDGEIYGRGVARILAGNLRQLGIRATRQTMASGKAGATIQSLRRSEGQAMVFAGVFSGAVVRLFNTVNRDRPSWTLFGSDGIATREFTERLSTRASKRAYLIAPTTAPDSLPAAGQDFYRRYRQRYSEPDPYAVNGYEAMSVVLDSLARATDPRSRADVVAAFFATRNRESVIGRYSIDRYGDTTLRRYGGYLVRRGLLVFDRVLDAGPA